MSLFRKQYVELTGLVKAYFVDFLQTLICMLVLIKNAPVKFQRDLVRAKLLPPMIAALESKDSEAQYWAMVKVLYVNDDCHV